MKVYRNPDNLPPFKNAVITIGSFDGVHTGHLKILSRLRALAEEINGESVVITFYPHPRNVLDSGSNTIQVLSTLEEKLALIEQQGIQHVVVVPFTFEFSRLSPREYVEKFIIGSFHPRFLVIGYDHKFGLNRSGDIHLFREYEAQGRFSVIEIPAQEIDEIAVSSSKIRHALLEGNIEEANAYLTRPYFITGKVVHGNKMGSKLGYPTANLEIADKEKLIPKEGIYAVKAIVETVDLEGMMYIGTRPTLSRQSEVSVEVHLFDFNQNIYDKNIQVHIWKRIRDDIRFETVEGLINQLKVDDITARTELAKSHGFTKAKAVITLAILNYNGVELLESYLPMLQYSSEKYAFDILVIDNGSTDLSVDFIREWYPEIRIVELSKNYGFAGGYNKGLTDIDTPYIALLNSDVLVTENWLDPILDHLSHNPETGAVQPEILSVENRQKYEYAGAAGGYLDTLGYPFCRGRIFNSVEPAEGQYMDKAEIFWASGAAAVIRTKVFKDLGGFDSGFFAHQEEIDLSWRMHRAGYRIYCLPESRVYHLGGGTLDYVNPRKDFLNFRNNLYMLAKNESFARLLWLIPARLILDGLAGLKFLLEGKPKSALAIIKAHMSFYVHLPLVLERRNLENELIRRKSIGIQNQAGRYQGSILWKYYAEGIRKFSELKF